MSRKDSLLPVRVRLDFERGDGKQYGRSIGGDAQPTPATSSRSMDKKGSLGGNVERSSRGSFGGRPSYASGSVKKQPLASGSNYLNSGGRSTGSFGGRSTGSFGGRPSYASGSVKKQPLASGSNYLNSGARNTGSFGGRQSYASGSGNNKPLGSSSNYLNSASKRPSSVHYSNQDNKKRMSNAMGNVRKDPRPIYDKEFKDLSARQLIEFLACFDYPHPVSMKMMRSPNTKDILQIFEFMYGFISPGYVLDKCHEEEVPLLFKTLGYPFTITKSAMLTVGSPHTWPVILAALSWLRNLVEVINKPCDILSNYENGAFMRYASNRYEHYLAGNNSFTEQDEQLKKDLLQTDGGPTVEELREIVNEQQTELEKQTKQKNELDLEINKQTQIKDRLENDLLTMTNFNMKADSTKREIKDDIEILKKQNIDQEQNLLAAEKELSSIKKQISNQPFTPSEIEEIHKKKANIKQETQFLEAQVKELDNRKFELQLMRSKSADEEHIKLLNCNEALNSILQRLPEGTAVVDLELTGSESDYTRYNEVIYPELLRISDIIQQDILKAKKTSYGHQQEVERLNLMLAEQECSLNELNNQIESQLKINEVKNKARNDEVDALQNSISKLKLDIAEKESNLSTTKNVRKRKMEELRKECTTMIEEQQRVERKYDEEMEKIEQILQKHKQKINIRIQEYIKESNERSKEIQILLAKNDKTKKK